MNIDETLDDVPPHPTKPAIYSSPLIRARRKRILHEARKLLAEEGLSGFGIRELSRRAEVAQRTIYNAFHSKDRVITLAIGEAYDAANTEIHYGTSADTLDGIVNRLITINTRNRVARTYSLAVCNLYFSANIGESIRSAIQHMSFMNLKQWLLRVEDDDELQPYVKRDDLVADFANMEFSIINDWAQGRIKDQEFVPRIVRSVLTLTMGVTRGRTQERARRYLKGMTRTGKLPSFPNPRRRVASKPKKDD